MAIIGQGIINAGAMTGGVGTIDAATLQGHPASYFTPMTTTAGISGAVANLQQQMTGVQNLTSRVVFKEAFTGNGSSNTFNLNGTILNAAFATGAWGSGYIVISMTAYITDLNGNVIYDSIIPIYRDKIQVTSVDSSGLVTTDFIPLAGQQGYIWYWYQLTTTDSLSYYYREDFVTYAESEAGTDVATAVYVGPTPFSNVVVKITDVTVDDALHAIDNYVAALSGAGTGSIGGSIEANQVAFGVDTNTVSGISGFTYDGYTLSVINGGTLPPVLPNLGLQVVDNINTYLQVDFQNLSDGDEASTDIVVTNNAGDDDDNWFDMGINGSNFSMPYWTVNGSSDAYLYANNANVAIGTASVGKEIVIFTGGTQTTNIRAKFTDTKIEFTPASSIVPGDTGFIFTGAINTGIATGTESHDILFNLGRIVTWEQGNVPEQSAVSIVPPTYAGEGPTTNTFTDASTVTIEGAPVAGANAVITNPKALWVKSGVVQVDGAISVTGDINLNGDSVATLSTVATISGDLQSQIDNISLTPGATGPIGITGATGVAGSNGATGVSGINGATGVAGSNGATGVSGASGVAGINGASGVAGINGASGATGVAGINGATGVGGSTGPVINHNLLPNIQGGTTDEYYHLTASEYANISGAGAVNTSVQLPWKYDNSTVSGDPGSSKFRLNNLTVASSTELYISRTTNNAVDGYNILNNLGIGDKIYLQRSDDATQAILVTISGTKTNNTTWFSIPITVDSAAASPTFTDKKVFSFLLINYTDLSGFVPYTGATSDVNLGAHKLTADAVVFNNAGVSSAPRQITWNEAEKTFNMGLTDDVTLQVGQEDLLRVHNGTGSDIANGQPVYICGYEIDDEPIVALASAVNSTDTSTLVAGVATETIPVSGHGFATFRGKVRNVNTAGYTAGQRIYLGEIPGTFTAVTSGFAISSHVNGIGYIGIVDAISGSIYVRITNEPIVLSLSNTERNILTGDNASTGIYDYSGMTIATSASFTVPFLKGWIVTNTGSNVTSPSVINVVYNGGTYPVTNLATSDYTHIFIDSDGIISQQPALPHPSERRDKIYLGKIYHYSRFSIQFIENNPDYSISPFSAMRDMFSPISIINDGITVYPDGNNLSFNKSAGNLYSLGINWTNDQKSPNMISYSASLPVPAFYYATRLQASYPPVSLIDPTKYDLAGVITSVPGAGGTATNQRIYQYTNGYIVVQYGQQSYGSLAAAIAGIQAETFVKLPALTGGAILLGVLSVTKNCTDLKNTNRAKFVPAGIFGDVTGGTAGISTTTLQNSYDNSTNPEIITDVTLGAVTFKNGTGNADDVTSVIEGQNTGGSVTSSILADGTGHFAYGVVDSISGAPGSIVTHSATGKLLDSGILATSLTPLTTTATISGSLQAQIDNLILSPGATGPMGPSGATGVTGASGVGLTGATGVSGASGVAGINGATGVSGASGAAGVNGATGVSGASGVNGATGVSGASGVAGVNGATGVSGASGVSGVNGATGVSGASGAAGVNGATGVSGASGVAGADGATGVAGINGATGVTGATGAGLTGATGISGSTGPIGATGPASPGGAPTDATLTYDIDGNLSTLTDASGDKAFYYDGGGSLVAISGSGAYVSKWFTYDIDGNLVFIDVA
jgi:hypothetical protein